MDIIAEMLNPMITEWMSLRVEAVCLLERNVLVSLNGKSLMKIDFHIWFREMFEIKVLLLTQLKGR